MQERERESNGMERFKSDGQKRTVIFEQRSKGNKGASHVTYAGG